MSLKKTEKQFFQDECKNRSLEFTDSTPVKDLVLILCQYFEIDVDGQSLSFLKKQVKDKVKEEIASLNTVDEAVEPTHGDDIIINAENVDNLTEGESLLDTENIITEDDIEEIVEEQSEIAFDPNNGHHVAVKQLAETFEGAIQAGYGQFTRKAIQDFVNKPSYCADTEIHDLEGGENMVYLIVKCKHTTFQTRVPETVGDGFRLK